MINEDVVVVFENCEVVRIPKSCMSSIWISGITEDVAWTPQMDTHISKYAKEARISIEHASDGVMSRCTKYKDVTQIVLDGVTYHIEWPEGHDYENPRQVNMKVGDKGLHIIINAKEEDLYE